MIINTTITPKVDLANERIILEEVDSTPDFWAPGGAYQRHVAHVIDLRDKATRDALICLGWRPPAEPDAQRSSAPVDEAARLRVRAHDPGTSVAAAEKATQFAGSHAQRILAACSHARPMTTAEIAKAAGLTVVQVARRTVELLRDKRLVVAQLNGEDMVVDGYRCWLLAPIGGQS